MEPKLDTPAKILYSLSRGGRTLQRDGYPQRHTVITTGEYCQRTKINLLDLPTIIALNTAAKIQKAKKSDLLCLLVIKHNCTGWPGKDQALALYWEPREMLHYVGAFCYGTRVVVPASMQVQTLSKPHEGHQDIDSPHFPHSNEMLEGSSEGSKDPYMLLLSYTLVNSSPLV